MKSEKLPASSKQQRGEQFKIQNYPNFNEEQKLWRKGLRAVVGLDEAGRGPLAGPVIAAAICLASAKFKVQSSKFKMSVQNSKFLEIRDSKKLTARQRDEWYKILTVNPDIKWGIGIVSEKIIDRINIFEATKLAMMRAIKNLRIEPEFILLDGNFILEDLSVSQKAVIRGDEKIFSCAAASIIAKVTRDRLMCRLSRKYPEYGFERHKGYGTKRHRESLKKHGACEIHRKSFRPVRLLPGSRILAGADSANKNSNAKISLPGLPK